MRVLTWHVHGSYLWNLAHVPVTWVLPTKPDLPEGYGGRSGSFPWPANVEEVPAADLGDVEVDVVMYQSHRNWLVDRREVLDHRLRSLPAVVLEHDPPLHSPTDTRHPVDDPGVLLVHVTAFNDLMWDPGQTPTAVVRHGVAPQLTSAAPSGQLARGIVAINHLAQRGRRLGADLFVRARRAVPLDLVGMAAEELGGRGEVPPMELPAVLRRYRFLFSPVRYTSLPLAVCEAMAAGVPVVALATTEVAEVIDDGITGFVSTDPRILVDRMRLLLAEPELARGMGLAAAGRAQELFGIERFARDWMSILEHVASRSPGNAALRG